MKASSLAITLTSLLLAAPVLAANPTATPGVDKREALQQQRIQQGVQSGQLTPREAEKLEKGQGKVERMEERAKADGSVTRQERQRLEHQQDVQSRQIHREKHDRQRDMNHDGRMDKPGKHYGKEDNPGKHKGWRNKK